MDRNVHAIVKKNFDIDSKQQHLSRANSLQKERGPKIETEKKATKMVGNVHAQNWNNIVSRYMEMASASVVQT